MLTVMSGSGFCVLGAPRVRNGSTKGARYKEALTLRVMEVQLWHLTVSASYVWTLDTLLASS